MSNILFVADVHLERSAWANSGIDGDSENSLWQVVAYANDPSNEISACVSLGDALDRSVNRSYAPAIWRSVVGKTEAPWYAIQGNHDYADPPWLDGIAESLHGKTLTINGFNLYGIDYCPRDTFQDALNEIPRNADGLACHQAWEHQGGKYQASVSDVPTVSHVFSGDYHVTDVLPFFRSDGSGVMFYSPGSVCMQSINEQVKKSFMVFNTDTRKISIVSLRTRPVISVTLHTREAMEAFLVSLAGQIKNAREEALRQGVAEGVCKPIVYCCYDVALSSYYTRLHSVVGESAFVYVKELAARRASDDTMFVSVSADDDSDLSPVSLLEHVIPKDEHPEAHKLAAALLENPEGAVEILDRFCVTKTE